METSDSENFESADEDFQSDEDDTTTIKSVASAQENDDTKCVKALEDIKITTITPQSNLSNNNSNKDTSRTVDDENNIQGSKECTVRNKPEAQIKSSESIDESVKNETTIASEGREAAVKSGDCKAEASEEIGWDDFESDWNEAKPTETQSISSKESNDNNKCDLQKKPNDKSDEAASKTSEAEAWDDFEAGWDEDNSTQTTDNCNDAAKKDTVWGDHELDCKTSFSKEMNTKKLDRGDSSSKDNMWSDDWEPVEPVQQTEKLPLPAANTSWGSWGSWNVSSFISTATQGVSTLTQGITTALESGIGVPDPEELARINYTEQTSSQEAGEQTDRSGGFGLGNLVIGVSHLTKFVESTGTKVISGGLDTLETIGKKTMQVLQEGDPGLKKKRAFLSLDQDKPVLSQLLKEAKEKAERENKILEEKHFAKKAKNYETLFDDHQGLVHLEALEMLSRQCGIKLQTLHESYADAALTEMQETMDQVKELCELPEEDDDENVSWDEIKDKLGAAVADINVPISYARLIETWEETETWLVGLKLEICSEHELHQQAIDTLAQLTAIAVEQFHKAGELLLVKEHRSTADEADSLVQLTTTLTSLIGIAAAKFSDKLNAKSSNSKSKEEINGLITNVFFEAANSSSYIQDAFQLLIPVLQAGAV